MRRDRIGDRHLAERAVEWLDEAPTAGSEKLKTLVRWLKKSPLHIREVLLAKALDEELNHIDPERRIDVDALIARASNNVIPVPADGGKGQESSEFDSPLKPEPLMASVRRMRRRLVSRHVVWWTIAATFCLVTLTTVVTRVYLWPTIDTDEGQWKTRALADGSVVRLGPRTKLQVTFDDRQRVVDLRYGEAVFKVASDAARPFIVRTDLAIARAIGTEFGVGRLRNDEVVVTTAEGSVSVLPTSLLPEAYDRESTSNAERLAGTIVAAGEQVAVTRRSPLAVKQVNASNELAWADGWLVFEHSTVADAVAAFNLRNRIQLVVDPALAPLPVKLARFRVDDPLAFATFLASAMPVSIITARPGVVRIVLAASSRRATIPAEISGAMSTSATTLLVR